MRSKYEVDMLVHTGVEKCCSVFYTKTSYRRTLQHSRFMCGRAILCLSNTSRRDPVLSQRIPCCSVFIARFMRGVINADCSKRVMLF